MGHGHELPEDLLRRVAAFCLVPNALLLRGVCKLWKSAFRCAPPMCAWYVQLAWQRAWYKEVAAIAQTAVYPCTRALAASSKEVWRIFTMADRFVTAPHGPVRTVMAQRLTLDGNQNLWLLSYLFDVDCWYVDVLQACVVEGRAMPRSLRRVVIRRSAGLPPGARRAEGCDGRWQEAFHAEEFLRSPQRRALAAIGKCGPGAYNWDGCVRVNRGASPLQWGPWILHSGDSRKSAALQLSHFPTGATLILGVGGRPFWPFGF